MRQRGRPSVGLQELTEVATQIRTLEATKTPCTKATLIKKLAAHSNISPEKAENAVNCAIRQGRVIELFTATSTLERVCLDVLSLRIRRGLRLTPNYDLAHIVRSVLTERGSRSSQDALSIGDIHDHIMTTYNLQENSVEYLANCLDKAIKLLSKKNQIEIKVSSQDNETRYFLTSSVANSFSNPPTANNRASTSSKDENTPATTTRIRMLKTKRRDKRRIEPDPPTTAEASNKSELKSLQDSLSAYYTPSNVRRSRVAQSSFSFENLDHKNMNPIEIVINNGKAAHKEKPQNSGELNSISSSKNSTPSPNNKRIDKLFDSLSPYFSANNEQRRKYKKGEYLQLNNGGMPAKKKVRSSMQSAEINSLLASIERPSRSDFFDEEYSDGDDASTTDSSHLLAVHRKAAFDSISIPSTKNESVAELEVARASSPSTSSRRDRKADLNQTSRSVLKSLNNKNGRKRSTMSRGSKNLLKRARQICHARLNRRVGSVIPMTPKKTRPGEFRFSSTIVTNNAKTSPILISSSPVRRTSSFSPIKALKSPIWAERIKVGDETPIKIAKIDEDLYQKTRVTVQKRMDENSKLIYERGEEGVFPSKIRIGRFEIHTWFSSPYPQEYACLPTLYICEKCLMYLCNDISHQEKCKLKYPPGNEIYRKEGLSIFEIDGNSARVYCRNLCLLAKLFMDHKTLYFDVEPFLFYVLTMNDEHGCHFVGYFSKEKYSHQQFNLACIVTLPCYQKAGYGRFLIDFSYLLSRQEKMLGTPERPLSLMGKIAYDSYWRSAIFEYLHLRRRDGPLDSLSAMEIAKATSIAVHDVVDTLKAQGFLLPSNGDVIGKNQNLIWTVDWDMIEKHWNSAKRSDRRIWLDESKLRWTPKIYTPNNDFFLRSPLRSPLLSPVVQPFRRVNQPPKKAAASTRFRIPIEHKSTTTKKHQKNLKAAVPIKNARNSGVQSEKSTTMVQEGNPCVKRQPPAVNLFRPVYKDFSTEDDSDNERTQVQIAHPQPPLSTAASSKTRKNYHDYSSCTSDSSDDENKTIFHRANIRSPKSSPAAFHASTGKIGRKKLPAEVERAQQQLHDQGTHQKLAIRRPLQRMTSVTSEQSSGEDSDFMKRTRRSSAAKKRTVSRRRSSGKTTKPNDEGVRRKGRYAVKRPPSLRGKKRSPTKQPKRSPSKSPIPELSNMGDNDSALNHDDNTDEDDEPYRSSASPPPLGKRQSRHSILHRTSMNQIVETMNMGGDLDTINMGGEPEDDVQPTFADSQTPKAPKPHATLEEEEEHESTISRSSVLHNHNSQISVFSHGVHPKNQFSAHPPPSLTMSQNNWNMHKQSTEGLPTNYAARGYCNPSQISDFNEPSSQQQAHTSMTFPLVGASDMSMQSRIDAPVIPQVKFMIEPSDRRNAEMPILNPGLSGGVVDGEISRLNEEDAVDDDGEIPPELSPMPSLTAETNTIENDEPESFEPPKLENATVSITPKALTPQPISSSSSVLVPKGFDPLVDHKTALQKQSMPASTLHSSAASTDKRFENDSFGGNAPLSIPPPQAKRQSPSIGHHLPYNSSHPTQMFSPQAVAVKTPNSLQPQSHASNSTISDNGINVSDLMSPTNLPKPIEHFPPPYSGNLTQQQPQQICSPTKPLAKSSSSAKDKPPRQSNTASRRRNTTDGTIKPVEQQQLSLDPKFVQPTTAANNAAALNGMLQINPHFMNPYLMPTQLHTTNNQFSAIQQPTPAYYDYTAQQMAAANYPAAFYSNGGFYPPYQTPDMLNQMPPGVNPFMSLYQLHQGQPQMQMPPVLPQFGQITNPAAITSNPATLMNNGAASLYYNGFT